jgi:hypothetical protein
MRILQDSVGATLRNVPQLAVEGLVERKLREQGITLSRERDVPGNCGPAVVCAAWV